MMALGTVSHPPAILESMMNTDFNIKTIPDPDDYVPAEVIDGKPVELRYSSAQTWRQCKRKWHAEEVMGSRSQVGWQANCGTFVHKVMELLFTLPPDKRTAKAASALAKTVWSSWQNKKSYKAQGLTAEGQQVFKDTAWQAITNVFNVLPPAEVDVYALERRVEVVDTPKTNLKWGGQADLVERLPDGTLRLIDWKTGKRRPDSAMPQVHLYGYCLQKELGDTETVSEVMVCWLNDGTSMTHKVDLADGSETLKAVEAHRSAYVQILAYAQQGEHHDYEPSTSALCGWCHILEHCDEGLEAMTSRMLGGRKVSDEARVVLAEKLADGEGS